MTYEETRDILKIMKTNYMSSFSKMTKQDSIDLLNLWAEAFKNDDARLVAKAVKSIIYSETRDFMPNIGKVKKRMFELSGLNQTDVGEAWELVLKNARCDLSWAKENYYKLPTNIQKALGTYTVLSEIGYMDNDSVNFARRDFERKYNEVIEDEKRNYISGLIDEIQIELNNSLASSKSINGIELSMKEVLEDD